MFWVSRLGKVGSVAEALRARSLRHASIDAKASAAPPIKRMR
jgi:hypothetical protein